MGLVIFTLPAFSPLSWLESSLFGEEAGAVSPGLADWATFAYPVVLSLIFVIAFIASALSGKEQAIVADDQGISVMRTRGRRRLIPWRDIQVFLHPIVRTDTLPTGGYFLWGREHGLFISPNPAEAPSFRHGEESRAALGPYRRREY
jgi:hypothetical protein